MRVVVEHGKIRAKQVRILVNHDQRIAYQDQIPTDQKEILKQLGNLQTRQHHTLKATHGMAAIGH